MSLEKIANNEALTKEDMIAAAHEYVVLEKQASDADAYGRQCAHEYVEKLAEEETLAEEKKEEAEEVKEETEEKTASLNAEELVVKIASYLKSQEDKATEQTKLAEAIEYVKTKLG